MMKNSTLEFFLGGADLEMDTIRALLKQYAPDRVHDLHLRWGAKASAYRVEIENCLAAGCTPVLIELEDDLSLDAQPVRIVDHHGALAGNDKPTSLHQVFALLDLARSEWTRWYELVAVNDRGYIPALLDMGATREEIVRVRAADRAAQGITPEEEITAERAAHDAETLAGGALTVVRLSHSRTAAVTDRMHPGLGGPGYRNLFVKSPDELNFYGSGMLVLALDCAFPGGWYGGALPEQGFWGHGPPLLDALPLLLREIEAEMTAAKVRHHAG